MLWGKLYQTISWWLRAKERVCDEQVLIDNFEEFCIQACLSNMYSLRLNTDVGNHQERFMAPVGKAKTQPAWSEAITGPQFSASFSTPNPVELCMRFWEHVQHRETRKGLCIAEMGPCVHRRQTRVGSPVFSITMHVRTSKPVAKADCA